MVATVLALADALVHAQDTQDNMKSRLLIEQISNLFLERGNMKASIFNVVTSINDTGKEMIIYNTHTTACVTLKKSMYEQIFVEKNFLDKEIVTALLKMGILVDDKFDEVKAIVKIRTQGMNDPVQSVVIFTTTECNARCYYCFEKGIKQFPMTFEVADEVLKFIKNNYTNEKPLGINWFGGEPLMNFKIIKYISDDLIKSGYKIVSHMPTNGSLFNEEMVEYFKTSYEHFSVQITLDAVDKEYGKIKRYIDINEDLAFDRVIKNVKMLLSNRITLDIRINFAASNIKKAKSIYSSILEILKGYDLSNAYIYMAPLTLDCDSEIISNYCGEGEHPYLQVTKMQLEEGFPLKIRRYHGKDELIAACGLMPTAYSCGMTCINRIVISADGELYKCHREAGKKQFSCGNVHNGINKNSETYKRFRTFEITDEDCKKCNILPICQGGCNYLRDIYGEKQKCHRIKQIKEELVKLYYAKTKNKGKEN